MLKERIVDEEHGNPLRVWHEMGEPANPTREQNELLRQVARPYIRTQNVCVQEKGIRVALNLKPNALHSFELRKIWRSQDTGYDYNRVLAQHVGKQENL